MSNKNNNFLGYETFTNTENPRARAYNRLITFYKVIGEHSISTAQRYIGQFDKTECSDIKSVYKDIQQRGLPKIRREISEVSANG